MSTVDFKKELPELYKGKADWVEVKVPNRKMLWLDGHGNPNAPEFGEAVGALFTVAYGLKFFYKKSDRDDFKVPPLEGLWDIRRSNTIDDADWSAMIPVPSFVSKKDVATIIEKSLAKKFNPRFADLSLVTYKEGLCLQRLYIGPYRDEAPVIADLHDNVIPQRGLEETGWHHEIYLSDPNRSAPEKLKTLLRQPVRRKR